MTPQLGPPVELPWWAPPAMLPPLLALVGGLLPLGAAAPLLRLADITISMAMIAVIGFVAVRVQSRNMQSVWISAAYAAWFFVAFVWLAADLGAVTR